MSLLREYISNVLDSEPIRIAVSGDVMFGRYVGYEYHPLQIKNPFNQVQDVFRGSDLSIVNLETPLYDGHPTWWKKYPLPESDYQRTLVAPTSRVNELTNAGINLVSLANNHSDDAGYEGFESTRSTLDTAGIMHAGTNTNDPFTPNIISIRGKKIVFFSVTLKRNFGNDWGSEKEYPPPLAYIDTVEKYEKFLNMISFQRSMHPEAFIIVAIHWGVQYKEENEIWQEILSKDIVDFGANCILGHHPHVLQKIGSYNGAIIFFSLGNLLFDHNYDILGHASNQNESSSSGAIFTFTIEKNNRVTGLKRTNTTSTPDGVII